MKYYAPTKLSENIKETPEGFLLCIGVLIARTGEQEYAEGETPLEAENGKVIIDRKESEVFKVETVASFEGKPITIQHPKDFVEPENWKRLAKGHMQNVRRGKEGDSDSLIADLLITDLDAISLVKNGLRGLSCGYEAEYIQTAKGRGEQRNIIGNHLALVEEGRAGPAYAINDQKGELSMSKWEKILAKLGITKDSKMALALDEAMKDEFPDAEKEKSKDAGAYDELVQICKDLGAKIDAMKPKDAAAPVAAEAKKEEPAKDEGGDMEARMKSLEEKVAALLAKLATGDEEEEEVGDESEEEEVDDEESEVVGDTASRAEILAPGLDAKAKDIKVKALKAAYATKDGKKAIDSLTGGKAPAYDSNEQVELIFNGASELLKSTRSAELTQTRKVKDSTHEGNTVMTAEKMNEMNANFYKLQ